MRLIGTVLAFMLALGAQGRYIQYEIFDTTKGRCGDSNALLQKGVMAGDGDCVQSVDIAEYASKKFTCTGVTNYKASNLCVDIPGQPGATSTRLGECIPTTSGATTYVRYLCVPGSYVREVKTVDGNCTNIQANLINSVEPVEYYYVGQCTPSLRNSDNVIESKSTLVTLLSETSIQIERFDNIRDCTGFAASAANKTIECTPLEPGTEVYELTIDETNSVPGDATVQTLSMAVMSIVGVLAMSSVLN